MKNIEILETKNTFGAITSYEVVEKIPAGFYVWNIGENMGTDEYIPLCEMLHPEDKKDYSINPDTLKAIKLNPDDVKILREAASYGADNKQNSEKALRREPKSYMAKKKYELAKKALPIFEKISE